MIHPLDASPFVIGRSYLVRTVTQYIVGRIVSANSQFIVMSNASWVPDTGRFSEALRTGVLSEVEPFVNNAIVGVGAIVDATEWTHRFPTEGR